MLSKIRIAHTKGEWTSGFCKTGAQANKPHLHEMSMRHTPRWWPFTPPPPPHFSEHMGSSDGPCYLGKWQLSQDWLLVKRAKDTILRHSSKPVWNEPSDCSRFKYPQRSLSGLSAFGLYGWANCSKGTVNSFSVNLKFKFEFLNQDVVARNLHTRKESVNVSNYSDGSVERVCGKCKPWSDFLEIDKFSYQRKVNRRPILTFCSI